jgi:hypothetical protein
MMSGSAAERPTPTVSVTNVRTPGLCDDTCHEKLDTACGTHYSADYVHSVVVAVMNGYISRELGKLLFQRALRAEARVRDLECELALARTMCNNGVCSNFRAPNAEGG